MIIRPDGVLNLQFRPGDEFFVPAGNDQWAGLLTEQGRSIHPVGKEYNPDNVHPSKEYLRI